MDDGLSKKEEEVRGSRRRELCRSGRQTKWAWGETTHPANTVGQAY